MSLLASLKESAFSMWLLESNSIWAYPTILTLHTFGMMALAGAALMIDLRLLGFGRDIPLRSLERLFRIMWAAFTLNAVTGTMLFVADAVKRGPQLIFWTKLTFVGVGLATAVMIRRRHFQEGAEPVVISGGSKRLAVVSLLAWSAAITAGRLLAYVG
jgi:hypothetical protein